MKTAGVEPFGRTPDGAASSVYTLSAGALRARITDFGGRMVSIEAPDRAGKSGHVLLGFRSAEEYARAGGSFGALLGRCANRVGGGTFTLDGQQYRLAVNEGNNTLHGGPRGFDKLLWAVESAADRELVLSLTSPDGDQGFPGELSARATYRLDESALTLELEAHTTKPTIVNLSAHPYFHLGGAENGDALGHQAMIASDAFLPTGADQLPTGEIRPVAGTVFDFRQPQTLGSRIRRADEQLLHGKGYDHCFVLRQQDQADPHLAARIAEPDSGRVLEVLTTQPALQLYSGNKLDGSAVGHGGVAYRQAAGFALEAQGFPDAVNHDEFPPTVLRPGQEYRAAIIYRFSTMS
jgi:aldose 1-epimerase